MRALRSPVDKASNAMPLILSTLFSHSPAMGWQSFLPDASTVFLDSVASRTMR